jgi:hypothetical protein
VSSFSAAGDVASARGALAAATTGALGPLEAAPGARAAGSRGVQAAAAMQDSHAAHAAFRMAPLLIERIFAELPARVR